MSAIQPNPYIQRFTQALFSLRPLGWWRVQQLRGAGLHTSLLDSAHTLPSNPSSTPASFFVEPVDDLHLLGFNIDLD